MIMTRKFNIEAKSLMDQVRNPINCLSSSILGSHSCWS